MSNQTGLSGLGQFEAFTHQWRDGLVEEAKKWCPDAQAAQLLADAVLAECRKKYADTNPPRNLEYYLRAQVCLVYSHTGQSISRLNEYIAAQSLDDKAGMAATASAPRQPEPPLPAQGEVESAPMSDAPVPEKVAEPAPEKIAEPVSVKSEVSAAPVSASASEAAATGTEPKKLDTASPDTFFDPVRTTLWRPDSDHFDHVVKEIEVPDEEVEERSVALSFVNTLLFVITLGAFGFCFYQTGFLQYLMQ